MNYNYQVKRETEKGPRWYSLGVVKNREDISHLDSRTVKDKLLHWMETCMEVRASDKIVLEDQEEIHVTTYTLGPDRRSKIKGKIFKGRAQIPKPIVQTQYNSKTKTKE